MNVDLRPLERRVLQLRAAGVGYDEIAWRFRRSPGFIRRVVELTAIPRRPSVRRSRETLRPVERVVQKNRERGLTTTEIAARMRRSPRWVEQVEAIAAYRVARSES